MAETDCALLLSRTHDTFDLGVAYQSGSYQLP
jgi:hypothetical protein